MNICTCWIPVTFLKCTTCMWVHPPSTRQPAYLQRLWVSKSKTLQFSLCACWTMYCRRSSAELKRLHAYQSKRRTSLLKHSDCTVRCQACIRAMPASMHALLRKTYRYLSLRDSACTRWISSYATAWILLWPALPLSDKIALKLYVMCIWYFWSAVSEFLAENADVTHRWFGRKTHHEAILKDRRVAKWARLSSPVQVYPHAPARHHANTRIDCL